MFDTHDLAGFQRAFLAAIVMPPANAPAGLRLHHDTWLFGLIDVLRARFETTAHALGEEAFSAFARDYITVHPLTSGDRNTYGDRFPAFLRAHPQTASLSWLADLAAFELALDLAHHAADAEPCALEALMAPDAVCTLHPSATVIRLAHDVKPLHAALQAGQSPETPRATACDLLIGRNGNDEVIRLCLATIEARFLTLIAHHKSLFAALEGLTPDENDLSLLQTLLARLVQNQLLTST